MWPRTLVVFLLLILPGAYVSAQSYYADVSIDVDSSGVADVSGRTNHPLLEAGTMDTLTSKKGAYWLFNLTLPENDLFSDYVYVVSLPEGSSVNYVKASGHFRITSKGGMISIIGSGENDRLSVVIEYQLSDTRETYPTEFIVPGFFLVLVVVGLFVFIARRRRELPTDLEKGPEENDASNLTDRQKEILRIIRESDKPVNQTLICNHLGLPKSSVSRNVDTLERKGFITKTRYGMSTLLSIRKKD